MKDTQGQGEGQSLWKAGGQREVPVCRPEGWEPPGHARPLEGRGPGKMEGGNGPAGARRGCGRGAFFEGFFCFG